MLNCEAEAMLQVRPYLNTLSRKPCLRAHERKVMAVEGEAEATLQV